MQTRPFSPDIIFTSIPALLPYLAVTLVVGVTSILTGSILGMLLAWAKLSGHKVIRALADGYTYIIRCTPSIVLLFIVFYGLPKFMEAEFGIDMDNLSRAIFVIITFTLLFGAYVSEVFRSAYETVDRGQYEAAVTIGLSPEQAFFRVMLPQAAVIALPNFGNSVINLMKESALAYTIGLIDLLGRTNLIISKNYGAYGVELYVACLLIYWALSFLIEQAFLRMESYLGRGRLKA
ncbi:amino acid ABC transporter permease [Dialister succinatiphilus]|uniref:amino acid ABC transporter permease n=1 Tax=Dialister succinatiphilus TaxID=487173 RepID=UPI002353B1B3|nr:amino acid ABC transporter permease [Dialister succinatiphilus]MCI6030377.1 amino acid ABC transporter permease [Dialister succinatiphilus]